MVESAAPAADASVDFLVRHADADAPWGEWIAQELERAGYRVFLERWDVRPGQNAVAEQDRALADCRHTVAVISPASVGAGDGVVSAAYVQATGGKERALIPVVVTQPGPRNLLGPIAAIDLVDVNETEARLRLLDGVVEHVPRVARAGFPGAPTADPHEGTAGVRFPATDPVVWELRGRKPQPHFVGRDDLLRQLRRRLSAGTPTALVQAVLGMGGVGKTRLAVEYAYQYGRGYDVVWWVRAETPETLLGDFAELAVPLGLPAMSEQELSVTAVRQELGRRSRWLLIFDNAEDRADVERLLPDRHTGHVLITTRKGEWPGTESLPVDVLSRDAAIDYLTERGRVQDRHAAGTLADALGRLPLALAQAAAVIATGIAPTEYLELLRSRAPELFREGRPDDYDATVTSTWRVSFDRLGSEPGAVALLRLCAFLAPDDIPLEQLTGAAPGLPADLASVLENPLDRLRATRALNEYSLAESPGASLGVHRLVQLIVRTDLADDGLTWARHALLIVERSFPSDPTDPDAWPGAERLLVHALTSADHAEHNKAAEKDCARLLSKVVIYLLARGRLNEAREAADRAVALTANCEEDDLDSLAAKDAMGQVLRALGRLDEARLLHEEVYAARLRLLGGHDRHTLASGRQLVWTRRNHGDYTNARILQTEILPLHQAALGGEDPDTLTALSDNAILLAQGGHLRDALAEKKRILEARRRRLGPDHLETLHSQASLANTLHALGELATARRIEEHVLDRRRHLLGDDHPDTLQAQLSLASTLHALGELATARRIQEHVLDRRRHLLGDDHPGTLQTQLSLAITLHNLGELAAARRIEEHVLDRCRHLLGDRHPATLRTTAALANTLLGHNDRTSARRLLSHTLETARTALGPRHSITSSAAWDLVRIHRAQGNHAAEHAVVTRDLAWLRGANPKTLSTAEKEIRQALYGSGRPGRRRS